MLEYWLTPDNLSGDIFYTLIYQVCNKMRISALGRIAPCQETPHFNRSASCITASVEAKAQATLMEAESEGISSTVLQRASTCGGVPRSSAPIT